jgi:ubiquinone/menaquinone biosynthesis C-methylase UbiE
MAKFHFVEDYERLVKSLVARHPIDVAMEIAVGGNYRIFGEIEADIVQSEGLSAGMRIVDLGCGSGRLASVLHERLDVAYLGIDIVEALLDYARRKAPRFTFRLHKQFSIPAPDGAADMVSAFSLFTHLLHAESFIYIQEAFRVLKPGGKLVFSFLEFAEPRHWDIFIATRDATASDTLPHLNTFMERNAIEVWAQRIGFEKPRYHDATAEWNEHQLGQSTAVLRKPA